MVEITELAILFKRRTNEETGDTTFIPYRVIEGCYDCDNEVFVDKNENTYHHLVDFDMLTGNAYGYRINIAKVISKNPKSTLKEIKKEFLEEAQKYYYVRKNDEYLIFLVEKTTMEATVYIDVDISEWYERYEQAELIYNENSEELPEEEPETSKQTTEINNKEADYNIIMNDNPITYVNKIQETIKGQNEAIKKIITAFWMHYNLTDLTKKNILALGPTGVGKTETFRQLAKILGIPITIYSVPGLTQSGYVGKSVDSILVKAYYECNKDIHKLENSIIVLDEIDKISDNGTGENIATGAVQQELLTLIEGSKRTVEIDNSGHKTFTVDTTNIIFVGTGAFQQLFEKPKTPVVGFISSPPQKNEKHDLNQELHRFGMMRELIGRMPIVVQFNNLTKDNLKDIIINSKKSEVKTIIKNLENLGITITNFDEILDLIIYDAIARETGARGIITTTTNIFSNIFYEIANNPKKYNSLTIGTNILKDPQDYTLTKTAKKRTKKIRK